VEKMSDLPITVTQDEGLLAGIALLFGWLAALIVWVTQKDKSRFVRFQAVQAIVFDLLVVIITILVAGLVTMIIIGVLLLGISDLAVLGSQGNPSAETVRTVVAWMTAIPFLIACIFGPISLVILAARIIAAVQTFQRKNFRYPWLGALVERSMD
jgi:uncharacterized membrane protein